jgi:4-amino-4-deoxy-L-arabinose transferase-like glycosyltransferase
VDGREEKRTAVGLLILLATVLLLTAGGRTTPGDEEALYRLTRNLIERGDLTLDNEALTLPARNEPGFLPRRDWPFLAAYPPLPGRDGRTYSRYGPGQSLAAAPLYLLGRLLALTTGARPAQFFAKLVVSTLNPLCTAATGALLYALARSLGWRRRTGLVVALAYTFTTVAWAYSKTFFTQPGATCCLVAAAYAARRFRLDRGERWLFVAGAALGAMLLFRNMAVMVVPAFVIYLAPTVWREPGRLRSVAAFGAPLAAALLLNAAYTWLRFGTFWGLNYPEVTADRPLIYGLYGLLFSPGKSFFLYNPVVLAGLVGLAAMVAGGQRTEAALAGLLFAVYLLLHAPLNIWHGGWNWGPRYLLPALPLLVLPAGALLETRRIRGARALLVALCLLGLVIQLPAVLVDHSRYMIRLWEQYPDDFYDRSLFETRLSPLLGQWPTVINVLEMYRRAETWPAARLALAEIALPAEGWAGSEENRISDEILLREEFLRLNAPDFWWLHLPLLGLSPWPGAVVAVGLLGVAVALGHCLYQRIWR